MSKAAAPTITDTSKKITSHTTIILTADSSSSSSTTSTNESYLSMAAIAVKHELEIIETVVSVEKDKAVAFAHHEFCLLVENSLKDLFHTVLSKSVNHIIDAADLLESEKGTFKEKYETHTKTVKINNFHELIQDVKSSCKISRFDLIKLTANFIAFLEKELDIFLQAESSLIRKLANFTLDEILVTAVKTGLTKIITDNNDLAFSNAELEKEIGSYKEQYVGSNDYQKVAKTFFTGFCTNLKAVALESAAPNFVGSFFVFVESLVDSEIDSRVEPKVESEVELMG